MLTVFIEGSPGYKRITGESHLNDQGWRGRGHQKRLSRRYTPWVELVKEKRLVGTVEEEQMKSH